MHRSLPHCRGRFVAAAGLALAATLIATQSSYAQAAQRAVFVGNNGNIDGSVTSFTLDSGGVPQFVQRLVLGSGSGNTGNNVYALGLSPNGRYLATTHATGMTPRLIHILRIHADATMTVVGSWPTPPTPMAAVWIDDEYLAVTATDSSSTPSRVVMYRFDEAGQSLTEVVRRDAGSFAAHLALHPNRQYLYAGNSGWGGPAWIRAFEIGAGGTLTEFQTEYTNTDVLGLSVTPNGKWLYGGSGMSGGNEIPAYNVDETTGMLSWMPGSPFISPGSTPSPKQAIATPDNRFLFVGHGRSAVVRSFEIDQQSGMLTDTGNAFTVGGQGDLGNIAVLDNLVFFTRQYGSSTHGPAGLFSFTVELDGSFTQNALADTGSTRPFDIAVWSPPLTVCYPDCDGNEVLNIDDFVCFINEFAQAQALPPAQQINAYANCDGSTTEPVLTVDDFICFINEFSAGCE